MNNHIHINRDFGWFIGGFDNNKQHRHYAIQLSIPLENQLIIKTPETTLQSTNPILIKSNVVHQVLSNSRQFLLLINPASTLGHFWNHLSEEEIQEVTLKSVIDLKSVLIASDQQVIQTSELNSIIEQQDCFCHSAIHKGDDRINRALTYLSKHSDRVVPLEDIAHHCALSPSRFLHLFKAETGITYRRAQLWMKLMSALPDFGKKSFTQIAHQNGFSDSAHLSRIFKENFGFSPREFLKISQFIQV